MILGSRLRLSSGSVFIAVCIGCILSSLFVSVYSLWEGKTVLQECSDFFYVFIIGSVSMVFDCVFIVVIVVLSEAWSVLVALSLQSASCWQRLCLARCGPVRRCEISADFVCVGLAYVSRSVGCLIGKVVFD